MAEIERRSRRADRSPWNWLLVLPVVVPLLTFLYNGDTPRLGGIPLFYWAQFAFIILGVACTALVYRMTRAGSDSTGSGSTGTGSAGNDSTEG